MSNQPNSVDTFAQLMKKSRLEMPFTGFEDTVMQRIEAEAQVKRSARKSVHLAIVFFLLGAGCGLTVYSLLSTAGTTIVGLNAQQVLLGFQLLFVVIVLSQLQNIIKLISSLKS